MKTKYILIALLSFALFSCMKDDTVATQSIEITASFSKETTVNDTKANIGEDLQMFWNNKDHLYLLATTIGTKQDGRNEFILTSGEGTTKGVFTDRGTYYNVPNYCTVDLSTSGNKFYVSNTDCSVEDWTFNLILLNEQIYNPSNYFGLADGNIIPLYGAVIVSNESFAPNNIKLSTPASIIKLELTNKTLEDINIGKITLTSSVTGKNEGLAGKLMLAKNDETMSLTPRNAANYMSADAAHKTITLKCSGVELKNDETKVFSFVVVGGYDIKKLTWKVYSSDETTQLGSDIVANSSEDELVLSRGKIYTKKGNLWKDTKANNSAVIKDFTNIIESDF